ncbi:ABC transporter permease [Campylobacter lari]|nr:ABC transporter permease [Campylobacter lari]EAJ6143439.1 ABC transporter permease [Campylobacter lari]EGG0462430.1 ABC transporter permease [Campylobacter lari]
MLKLIFKRLLWAFFLMIFASFLCFVMIYHAKGSVVFASVPQGTSLKIKEQIERNLNLDKPLLEQYENWLFNAMKGDFSYSLISGEKVSEILKEKLPYTIILGSLAFLVLFVLSLVLALFCVLYKDSFLDKFITFLTMSFFALPAFSLSLMLILVFAVFFKLFPSSAIADIGFEDDVFNRLWHLFLPVCALVLSHLAVFVRFIRTSLIDSLNQSFIESAFARGLSKTRIYLHFVLKDAFGSILAYFGASFVSFLMGTYIVESVFSYEGVGNLVIKSILFKDYPVVLAVVIFSILVVVLVNLIVEIICKMINPRFANA